MKRETTSVFFNTSVVIAGLISPSGGSAKLLSFVKREKVRGIVSEIVLDEVLRHSDKIRLTKNIIVGRIKDFEILTPGELIKKLSGASLHGSSSS